MAPRDLQRTALQDATRAFLTASPWMDAPEHAPIAVALLQAAEGLDKRWMASSAAEYRKTLELARSFAPEPVPEVDEFEALLSANGL